MTTAVTMPGVDAAVPWHYGDPFREQRVLRTGAGVVDRSNRDVLQVTGEDRLDWLHTICSQHLTNLVDGDATQALVLSPHGHVEQDWQLVELNGTVWIDTEPGAAATVLDYLQKMRFLKRVEPMDVTVDWAGAHARRSGDRSRAQRWQVCPSRIRIGRLRSTAVGSCGRPRRGTDLDGAPWVRRARSSPPGRSRCGPCRDVGL